MIVEPLPSETHRLVREARRAGKSVGCVPTMGALHAGHVSLIERARKECDFVVGTIFVNPTQFGPNEDFSKYPRTLESDLEMCRQAGADLVFTPQTSSMYSPLAQTIVRVDRLASVLEGAHRPGHFDGVSTVVTKLFNITEPDRAYFGQKDFQQQLIIRQMVEDLNQPVEIVTCPIIREPDGLAMSSRNRYLSPDERQRAGLLSQALRKAKQLAKETTLLPGEISAAMIDVLRSVEGIDLQYAVITNRRTLELLTERSEPAVALIAAKVGTTRLIDNEILHFG
jgi:pantoate--beta-alanine ligase